MIAEACRDGLSGAEQGLEAEGEANGRSGRRSGIVGMVI
jgi:hypothetical protein